MREQFRNEMKNLQDTLEFEAASAAKSMKRAARALQEANLTVAQQVIDADRDIDILQRTIDENGVSLLARQAPVTSDLRTVISALRLSGTLERMGDLAGHVAYIARGRYPQTAASGELHDLFVEMSASAAKVGENLYQLVKTQNLELAAQIIADDDVLDELHRRSFEIILDPAVELTRQEIVDAVLLGRYLERFGDHAVKAAYRIRYWVTGTMTEKDMAEQTSRGQG